MEKNTACMLSMYFCQSRGGAKNLAWTQVCQQIPRDLSKALPTRAAAKEIDY